MSKYLQFLNWGWTTSGAYFLDLADNRMACRAGFNATKFEKQLPAPLFAEVAAPFIQMARRLGDLRQVAAASVRGGGEGYVIYRGSTHEEVVAAVSTVMEQVGDSLCSDYRSMVTFFSRDVGTVLEEINA